MTYRKGELNLPENLTKEQLAQALAVLVEKGQLNPALLHAEVAQVLTEITAEQHHKAAQVMRQAQESQTAAQAKRQTEAEFDARHELSPEQKTQLISTLKTRFKKNQGRHKLFLWSRVEAKLNQAPAHKLWSLWQMEETSGQPDVVDYDSKTGEYIFFDCSPESPTGRRNLCWNQAAQDFLKANHPDKKCDGNAVTLAEEIGIEILNETQYRYLQKLGEFDLHTRSWVKGQSESVALYGGRYDGGVFVFERSPDVHAAGGAFRGSLRV